ncbi:hypothetical protein O7634_30690 [Micromonospora sp. WMMD1120]|uniref:hypothetical protein n=1 Tax=Micromonospora sp. WMMD1120 TaxID=3016106 RepID=UPI002416C5FB|nr:hypothetical protein [Micromonospora sp. WMMD1120]MDG4811149.1 hypothetical protein [Micromonospora sp. WMMD1120]
MHLELRRNGRAVLATERPFLLHPCLHDYGTHASVPDERLVPWRAMVTITMTGCPRRGRSAEQDCRWLARSSARLEKIPSGTNPAAGTPRMPPDRT